MWRKIHNKSRVFASHSKTDHLSNLNQRDRQQQTALDQFNHDIHTKYVNTTNLFQYCCENMVFRMKDEQMDERSNGMAT